MTSKTPQNDYTSDVESRHAVRIVLWFIFGALILAAICCFCTLAVGWFTGDFFVNLFRQGFGY